MQIAIQGQKGSFHYMAAQHVFGSEIETVDCTDFSRVFKAVDTGIAEYGVVAIENSLYGTINDTYDLLLDYRPWIIGEVYVHIKMHLLAKPGSTLQSITDVYSQAPALAQCRRYLQKELPQAQRHEWNDTAEAAKHVAQLSNTSAAAIAAQAAGKLYGLESIAKGIEDKEHSYTRFFVIQKTRTISSEANKATGILITDHSPGALHRALGIFARNEINLSALTSRPIPGPEWRYMFYIDFEKSADAPETKRAIEQLSNENTSLKILGSYQSQSPQSAVQA